MRQRLDKMIASPEAHQLGFEVYRPEYPILDIVFIHGIQGHSKRTPKGTVNKTHAWQQFKLSFAGDGIITKYSLLLYCYRTIIYCHHWLVAL